MVEKAVDVVTLQVGVIMDIYYRNGRFGVHGDLNPEKERRQLQKELSQKRKELSQWRRSS